MSLVALNPFNTLRKMKNDEMSGQKTYKVKKNKYDFMVDKKEIYQLSDLVDAGYCLYDLMNKCKGTQSCKLRHLKHQDSLYKFLNSTLSNLKKHLRMNFNKFESQFKLPLSYGPCLYALRGIPCINELHKRIYLDDGNNICFSDSTKARKKIMAGFHLDLQFQISPLKLVELCS